jgi:hypothetical protein
MVGLTHTTDIHMQINEKKTPSNQTMGGNNRESIDTQNDNISAIDYRQVDV